MYSRNVFKNINKTNKFGNFCLQKTSQSDSQYITVLLCTSWLDFTPSVGIQHGYQNDASISSLPTSINNNINNNANIYAITSLEREIHVIFIWISKCKNLLPNLPSYIPFLEIYFKALVQTLETNLTKLKLIPFFYIVFFMYFLKGNAVTYMT